MSRSSVDNGKALFSKDVQEIESTVRDLEAQVNMIRAYLKKEEECLPRSQAILRSCCLQGAYLDHIATSLPRYLPSTSPSGKSLNNELSYSRDDQKPREEHKFGTHIQVNTSLPLQKRNANSNGGAGVPGSFKTDVPKVGKGLTSSMAETAGFTNKGQAPRKYITQDEFKSVSTYMRGRLTADKVNAALSELASHAETNAMLVAAAKKGKSVGVDRKHAQWLAYCIAGHESLRGKQWWVMESDLRGGRALKMDNSGRMILTLLRHVGRLSETRISVDGSTHVVHILN